MPANSVALTARVVADKGKFVARVEKLPLEAVGASPKQAQDELINAVRLWIELQDTQSSLEAALTKAGFAGADEDTEIQLQFVET